MHELRAQFRHCADFVLSGHEHVQSVALVDDALSSQSGFIEAGALSADDGSPSSFNVLEIDLDAEQFQSLLLEIDDDEYMPRDLAPAWSSFRSLPAKRYSGFEISAEFKARLSDPGARFTHPIKGALSLDDVFVFPDLRELSQQETDRASRLSSNTFLGKGGADRALLVGEEKAGKTSLLFQLFQGFHDQGLVPVYLQASEISGTTEREMEMSITRAIEREYGKDATDRFWKTKTDDRVCLIDDYDRMRGNERYRPAAITYAKKHFQRLYITTTDTYQLEEYVLGTAATALKDFRTFLILQFGHRLRYHLIRKWTCGGNESSIPLAELTENVDRCERIVDNVLGNSFVPALPLFLLTLLQSIEARTHTDLSQSAFGHYYAYLITRGLNEAKVKKEELDELFNYCAFLAYEFEKAGAREIHIDDLRRFTAWYSETFTPVNFDRRMEQLTDAGILAPRSGGIGFKYPYFRYYFLGKYYADQMQKKDAAAVELAGEVRSKCRNLHIRENANTVLFLTHHTKDRFVFDEIVAVLRALFAKRGPLKFESDVSALSELVEATSKTVVEEWDVEKNREKLRRLQDDLDDKKPSAAAPAAKEMRDEIEMQSAAQGDSDAAKRLQVTAGERITEDEAAESANLLGDLNVLFKTVDLLGQILKSYYGSLTNDTKREFMREVFRGPLRALADFFAFLSAKQDALVLEVEAEIARRDADVPEEKRRQVAQQAVFNTIGVISFVFIAKAADAVNASTLRMLTRELADKDGSVAAKIIQLAAILDSSEDVPVGEIRSLMERLDGNIFAKRVVESLVFRHLYMFPTSVKEKQQIEDLLKFDMHGMRALDLKTKAAKITKKAS
jgi:hypothetical protein